MNQFLAIVKQELLAARRERLPQVLLVVFLFMVGISSFIGWATNHTVTNVYKEAVSQGITTAPNPFASVPSLYYARNTVIYIVLIGALLAIILGVGSVLRDRKSKTIDLLLSRPVNNSLYLVGKLGGLSLWLLGILGISFAINWASISLILGHGLAIQDSAHLLLFYGLSWVFLVPFIVLGMASGIFSRRETSALLVPIVVFSIITFVLPQLGTAEHPTALLNPVPATVTSQGFFFRVNRTLFAPISVTERFKHSSGVILKDSAVDQKATSSTLLLGGLAIASVGLLLLIGRSNMRRELYE